MSEMIWQLDMEFMDLIFQVKGGEMVNTDFEITNPTHKIDINEWERLLNNY